MSKVFKSIVVLKVCFCLSLNLKAQNQSSIRIIPYPSKITITNGVFELLSNTKILVEAGNEDILIPALSFIEKMNKVSGFSYQLQKSNAAETNSIYFYALHETTLGEEGYLLSVSEKGIRIGAENAAGWYYGLQTLYQLLPVEIESEKFISNVQWQIPFVEIEDKPRFLWRGLHLDVSRHFFSVDAIKKLLDNMAMHKLNTFHWHLTDDQGWRIEVNKYPKLTEIGSRREETLIVHQYVRPMQFDGSEYKGFYTQEQIKEVVQYALDRNITIVPEIDMPGHASAAIAAYPSLGVTNEKVGVVCRWGVFPNIYNVNDSTFYFLESVLTEVMELFPGRYIHIGGDEAKKDQWNSSSLIQLQMRQLGLNNEHDLQSYFIKRIEKFVNSKGRTIIGWDEILEGGLAPNAVVMSWRGEEGGVATAKAKHKVVMTPGSHLYFDFYQGASSMEPLAIGGFTPLDKVYNYEPVPQSLNHEEGNYILGAQANIWTEYISSEDQLEYMIFPRVSALAEVVWTSKENKDWKRFANELPTLLQRYQHRGINYSKSSYNVTFNSKWKEDHLLVTLDNPLAGFEIRYTLDGAVPNVKSSLYKDGIKLKKENTRVKATLFRLGVVIGAVCEQEYKVHKAYGKKLSFVYPYDTLAFVTQDYTLVDGIKGDSKNMYSDTWQRFKKVNLDVTIDLNKAQTIKTVKSSFIQIPGYSYAEPSSFEIETSVNGKDFKKRDLKVTKATLPSNTSIIDYTIDFSKVKARYIRMIAKNPVQKLNELNGKLMDAVLMLDEIEIE